MEDGRYKSAIKVIGLFTALKMSIFMQDPPAQLEIKINLLFLKIVGSRDGQKEALKHENRAMLRSLFGQGL